MFVCVWRCVVGCGGGVAVCGGVWEGLVGLYVILDVNEAAVLVIGFIHFLCEAWFGHADMQSLGCGERRCDVVMLWCCCVYRGPGIITVTTLSGSLIKQLEH